MQVQDHGYGGGEIGGAGGVSGLEIYLWGISQLICLCRARGCTVPSLLIASGNQIATL